MIGYGLHELSRHFDDLAFEAPAPAGTPVARPSLPRPGIEPLTTKDGLATAFSELHDRARRSIEACEGTHHAPGAADLGRARREALERGVDYRVVYDPPALKLGPHAPALPPSCARVSSSIPARMVIRDGEEALIFSADHSSEVQGVLIRSPWIAALLKDTFEVIWGSALPLPAERVAAPDLPDTEEREILRLLATGLTDESIARFLGVSLRTVQRKVQAIQRSFGATSRFQLGVMSAA